MIICEHVHARAAEPVRWPFAGNPSAYLLWLWWILMTTTTNSSETDTGVFNCLEIVLYDRRGVFFCLPSPATRSLKMFPRFLQAFFLVMEGTMITNKKCTHRHTLLLRLLHRNRMLSCIGFKLSGFVTSHTVSSVAMGHSRHIESR